MLKMAGRKTLLFIMMISLACGVLLINGEELHSFSQQNQKVTYTLIKNENPTERELEAYKRIRRAMNKAVNYYNQYTDLNLNLTVSYNPNVKTADGNIKGSIRFGDNFSYMNHVTAMHEISHTAGVGTSHKWKKLVKNRVFTGKNATRVLREITNDPNAVINSDKTHFWPYGLNYHNRENKTSDLINHAKIVNAMVKDLI